MDVTCSVISYAVYLAAVAYFDVFDVYSLLRHKR